jgi:hypothetical protein
MVGRASAEVKEEEKMKYALVLVAGALAVVAMVALIMRGSAPSTDDGHVRFSDSAKESFDEITIASRHALDRDAATDIQYDKARSAVYRSRRLATSEAERETAKALLSFLDADEACHFEARVIGYEKKSWDACKQKANDARTDAARRLEIEVSR